MDKNGQIIQFRHVLQAQGSRLASAATASVQQIAREPTSPLTSAPPFAASQPRRSRALIDALVHNGADASAAWGPNFAPLRSLSQVTPSYPATATPEYTSQPVAPAPTYSATSTPTPTYTSAPALTPAPIEELPKPSCTIETTGCITLNATSATVTDAIQVCELHAHLPCPAWNEQLHRSVPNSSPIQSTDGLPLPFSAVPACLAPSCMPAGRHALACIACNLPHRDFPPH